MGDQPKYNLVVQAGMRCYRAVSISHKPNVLRLAVVANEESKLPLGTDIAAAVRVASDTLRGLTGKSLQLTELCYGRFGRYSATAAGASNPHPQAMLQHYITTTSADLSDYVVVLATDDASSTFGGHTLASYGVTPEEQALLRDREPHFCQRAASPVTDDQPMIYGAVIQGVHPVGGCGEVPSDDGESYQLDEFSSGSQCRGEAGLRCVRNTSGRTFCPGDEKDPTAQPIHFMAMTMVHELGHFFGSEGNNDHFGEWCFERGAIHTYPPQDNADEKNAQICPDVWQRVRSAGLTCLLPEADSNDDAPSPK